MYLLNIYKKYNIFYKKINFQLSGFYKNLFFFNFKILNNHKILINNVWKKQLIKFYPTRFNESSINKNIELNNLDNYLIFYIRKNRIFNKGRYSRNRQLYRTGVYWCIWLNIILVYGLYFLFYRFTFNFGYFWWGMLIFFYSMIFSRAVKYNFHNTYKLYLEFFHLTKWIGYIFISFNRSLKDFIISYKFIINKNQFYLYISKTVFNLYKNLTKLRTIYFWEGMSYEDTSLFRYKTVIHWLSQFYKLMTY